MAKMKTNLRREIAKHLNKLYPDYEFSEEWVYREYGGNSKNGYLCRWSAEGRKYKSFLRYDSFFVNGIDTMKDCAKDGIRIVEGYGGNIVCAK